MRIARTCSFSLALAALAGCGGKSEPGGAPTGPTAGTPVQISNLRASEIGLDTDLCPQRVYYKVWDELLFDYQGATEQQITGANLSYLQPDGLKVTLGAIARCQAPAAPCSNGGICLLTASGATGSVRAVISAKWQPSWTWNLLVDSPTPPSSSNALAATVDRPDRLPTGDKAVFISLRVTRTIVGGGSYDFVIYSPGIPGRVIMHRLRVLENGKTFSATQNNYYSSSESASSSIIGSGGGLSIPSGQFDAVADFIERDALGSTVSTGTATVHVP